MRNLALALILSATANHLARAAAPSASTVAPPAAAQVPAAVIDVALGESVVRLERRAVKRVLLSDPGVADLRLLEEGQYQVRGLRLGSTDLWVWYADAAATPVKYTVVVGADLADLQRRVGEASAGAPVRVYALRERVVVEGVVPDVETLEHVVQLVRVHDKEFVNLLTVRGDHQVQLKVVFAEVNRTSLRELGLNALLKPEGMLATLSGPQTSNLGSSVTYQSQGAAPSIGQGVLGAATADAFQLVGYVRGVGGGAALLSVLEQNDVARTLARPTLAALSGQEATFLGGGRIPIPVQQQNNQISIAFEEYGVKLSFVPTVLAGEVIDVATSVEVSELDRGNALKLSGVEVPAITTRKGQSRLRIGNGMTFALAGMLSERVVSTRAGVPLLSDIPVVGALFRYVRHQRTDTELVIFVTPELIRPLSAGEVPVVPGSDLDLAPSDLELFLLGHAGGVGAAIAPVGPVGVER